VTDLDMLRRAMLLDPWDDVARLAYLDEFEAEHGGRPDLATGWGGSLEEFMRAAGCLFDSFPVREVSFTNKYPLDNSGVEGYFGGDPRSPATSWFWIPQATPGVSWEVPIEFRIGWANSYATPEAALGALSLHAVNYGRSLAGLPPLPPRA
jgi:hypothetical protein